MMMMLRRRKEDESCRQGEVAGQEEGQAEAAAMARPGGYGLCYVCLAASCCIAVMLAALRHVARALVEAPLHSPKGN